MPFRRTASVAASLSAMIALAPAAAFAAEPHALPKLSPARVFADAPPLLQLLMAALLVATLAAVVVTALKLASKSRAESGYLSALRIGGPLAGLLGAAYTGLMIAIGIANVNVTLPLAAYTPGLSEAALALALGLVAGVVAVVGGWLLDARPIRTSNA